MSADQSNMSADEMIRFLSGNDKFCLYGEGKREYGEEELQKYGLPGEYTPEETLKGRLPGRIGIKGMDNSTSNKNHRLYCIRPVRTFLNSRLAARRIPAAAQIETLQNKKRIMKFAVFITLISSGYFLEPLERRERSVSISDSDSLSLSIYAETMAAIFPS